MRRCRVNRVWLLIAMAVLAAEEAPARQERPPLPVMSRDTAPWTKGEPSRFAGNVEAQPMTLPPGNVRVSRVRHEPGAHTHWHVHEGGQVLYVESGRGRIQRAGGAIQEVVPGDVIFSPPGEKHWHGAVPGSPLVLVVTSLGGTEWLEKAEPK
jgi:quercetin dioxygenase-like cupin family protein